MSTSEPAEKAGEQGARVQEAIESVKGSAALMFGALVADRLPGFIGPSLSERWNDLDAAIKRLVSFLASEAPAEAPYRQPQEHVTDAPGWLARRLAEGVCEAPAEAPAERSSADWRRLTGLWRYGVAVCPPTCTDFYNWLGILDAAIDERTSRSPK